jgi:hypothetical protein
MLVRAPFRQRDEARQQIDTLFPEVVLPSEKKGIYDDLIREGESIETELDSPYERIARWEKVVNTRLGSMRLRGAMASELDGMGAGVTKELLLEYMDRRITSLWKGMEPISIRMLSLRHPKSVRPRLPEPPQDPPPGDQEPDTVA